MRASRRAVSGAPVALRETPRLTAERPFLVTSDYRTGELTVCIKLAGQGRGRVRIRVSPHNFAGDAQWFTADFDAQAEETRLRYTLKVQNPRLWWPNGYGEQALYEVLITVEPDDDLPQVFREVTGLRQIEMRPLRTGRGRIFTTGPLRSTAGKFLSRAPTGAPPTRCCASPTSGTTGSCRSPRHSISSCCVLGAAVYRRAIISIGNATSWG